MTDPYEVFPWGNGWGIHETSSRYPRNFLDAPTSLEDAERLVSLMNRAYREGAEHGD